jgi:hypothetical protein
LTRTVLAMFLLPLFAPGQELPRPADPTIVKARSATAAYLEHLPNYVCQEVMTRFNAYSRTGQWRQVDVVTTDLVYEDGREDYRNVALNGLPVRKGIEALPGSWSVGEFATGLAEVFSPVADAEFQLREESRLAGRDTYVYDYRVRRERSQWIIKSGSGVVVPAYGGSIWIDKETSRVLRIERRSEKLPSSFPWDTLEGATQYDFVRLGQETFLLPVHSESVSCERRFSNCMKNVIDFRSYRKFTSESTISFGP